MGASVAGSVAGDGSTGGAGVPGVASSAPTRAGAIAGTSNLTPANKPPY